MPIRQNLDGAGPPVAMQWPRFTRWQRLFCGVHRLRDVGMFVAVLGLLGTLPGCMGPVSYTHLAVVDSLDGLPT